MRVPFIQLPRKLPLKTVAIVGGVGAAARCGLRRLLLDAGQRVARRGQRAGRPPRPRHGNRLPAAQPVARAGRDRRAPHREHPGLPRRRQDHRAHRRCRHRRQAGRPDRPARPGRLPPGRRQCPRSPRLRRRRLHARQGRPRALSQSARHGCVHAADARAAPVARGDHACQGRAGQKPALLGREQPRLHRAARRRARRRHRRPGRGRPGHDARPGRGAGRPHRRARNPGRRARASPEGGAPGQGGQLRTVVRSRPSPRRHACASSRPAPTR